MWNTHSPLPHPATTTTLVAPIPIHVLAPHPILTYTHNCVADTTSHSMTTAPNHLHLPPVADAEHLPLHVIIINMQLPYVPWDDQIFGL